MHFVAYLCEGTAARWGISLKGVDVVMAKSRLLVVVAGGHGRSVAEAVLMSSDFDMVDFLDDGAFASGGDLWGLPVLGPANAFAGYAALATHAVVAIGNNALRQQMCAQLQAAGFALARVVHHRAIVSRSVRSWVRVWRL